MPGRPFEEIAEFNRQLTGFVGGDALAAAVEERDLPVYDRITEVV